MSSKNDSKTTSHSRPKRKAAQTFLNKLEHYRKIYQQYQIEYRRYAQQKKKGSGAKPPAKPRIPLEFYQHLTDPTTGDADDTSDDEFSCGTEEAESLCSEDDSLSS